MEKYSYLKTYIFIFLVTFCCALFAYAINGIYPFGSLSVLTADLYSQYIDVTTAFFEQLKAGESVFITYKSGLGSNLLAIALYTMANPLSMLFLFTNASHYQDVYFLIILIKIAFTGVCFAVYASRSRFLRLKSKGMLVVFSLCYALNIFTLKAAINPMWLENIALLPVIFLGVERIAEKRKPMLFLVAVTLCFITNYYLSYITGIFTIIYFIYYLVIFDFNKKDAAASFGIAALFTVLAAGLAMVVLLPSFAAVSGTYTDILGVGFDGNILKFSFKDILFAFTHVISNNTASGLPNGYFGVFALWLSISYFINKKISKKDKIFSAVIMIFFIMSLIINPLYYAWHLFRAPTGFDARFLYGVILFSLILAIQSFKCFDGVNKKHFFIVGIILLVFANYSVLGRVNVYYIISIGAVFALIGIYGFLLISGKGKKLIYIAAACEMLVVCCNCIRIVKLWDTYGEHREYIAYATDYKNNFKALSDYDDGFYRSDCDKQRGYNSPLSIGYNGINHFSSLANQKTFEIMRKLGVTTLTDNKVLTVFGNNVVLDSLFNIKYFGVMDREDKSIDNIGREIYYNGFRLTNPNYQPVFENESSVFYENSRVFPLMFGIANNFDFTPEGENAFENQNLFFEKMFDDKNLDLYQKTDFDTAATANCNVTITEDDLMEIELTNLPEEKIAADTSEETGVVELTYTVKEEGNYFTQLSGEFASNAIVGRHCQIMVNDIPLTIFKLENELKDLGWFEKGDIIKIRIYSFLDTKIYMPSLYRLNDEDFNKISEKANIKSLEDIREIDGDICGVSDFENEQLVFSSVAYDEGFSVYIDGIETEKIKIADGFLGYYVPKGRHNIKITYISPGFILGKNISCISLILTILVLLVKLSKKEKFNNG